MHHLIHVKRGVMKGVSMTRQERTADTHNNFYKKVNHLAQVLEHNSYAASFIASTLPTQEADTSRHDKQ